MFSSLVGLNFKQIKEFQKITSPCALGDRVVGVEGGQDIRDTLSLLFQFRMYKVTLFGTSISEPRIGMLASGEKHKTAPRQSEHSECVSFQVIFSWLPGRQTIK